MNDILKQTMSIVREYAVNLNILVVDDEKDILDMYQKLFGRFFKICDRANDGQEALDMWLKNPSFYDLIVTDVDMPRMDGLELIKNIREKSLSQSIIVITGNRDLSTNQDIAYNYVDAILPKPFQFKTITPLLSRVVKKISDQKDLEIYLKQLEQFSVDSVNTKLNVNTLVHKIEYSECLDKDSIIKDLDNINKHTNDKVQVSGQKLTSLQTDDIRFSTASEQISASQLIEILDDTIMDKVEILIENIDGFIEVLYIIEKEDAPKALADIVKLRATINELSEILGSIGLFDILLRACNSISNFLDMITEVQLEDENKKSLLTAMLLGLIKDMEDWIKIVFIEQSADNIYYFDASFSNNCLEIVAIFNEQEIQSDEDDLEFF